MRNLGHSGVDGDTELRDAINAGHVPGPRILASGRKLHDARRTTFRTSIPRLRTPSWSRNSCLLTGWIARVEAVRKNEFQNVDVIKVTAEENLTRS